MWQIWFLIKFYLKLGSLNDRQRFRFERTTWLGKGVSVYIEPGPGNQKICLGKNVRIGHFSDLTADRNNQIIIKDNSTLNTHCKIIGDVTIERYCLFSSNILVSSGQHYATEFPHLLIQLQDKKVLATDAGLRAHSKPVHIDEDVWIGFNVFIKQGVKIGRGAVIGANSSVLQDVRPYSIVAGSPAKHLRFRFEFEPPAEINAADETHRPYFYCGFDHLTAYAEGLMALENCTITLASYTKTQLEIVGYSQSKTSEPVVISASEQTLETIFVDPGPFTLRVTFPESLTRQTVNHYSFITFAGPIMKKGAFLLKSAKILE